MLYNIQTQRLKQPEDCMQCAYYSRVTQTCKGLGINCIDQDLANTKIAIEVNGKSAFLPLSEIKLSNGKTLGELIETLNKATEENLHLSQRMTKIEEDIAQLYRELLES